MKRLLIAIYLFLPGVLQAQVIPTNEWVSFWSDHTIVDFQPIPAGSVVRAHDPQGVLCGEFTVTTPGQYGLMPVYRDDPTTPGIDEGAEPGDVISFEIDGVAARPFGQDTPVWTSNGDIKRVNLVAGDADLDIRPGSCPNPFNTKLFVRAQRPNASGGAVLPVVIIGTERFDVNDVDISTIRLEGVEPLSQGGGPSVADVGAPVDDRQDACDCTEVGPDGIADLQMKFSGTDIALAIGPGMHGEERLLTMTFNLLDGAPFEIRDCIRFVGRGSRAPTMAGLGSATLRSAFPNPFNPVTRIGYVLPEEGYVSLAVYDVRGRRVEQLVTGVMPAGEHVAQWDARTNPSGIYFIRLQAGGVVANRKIILLK
jgi:hypothetical protein